MNFGIADRFLLLNASGRANTDNNIFKICISLNLRECPLKQHFFGALRFKQGNEFARAMKSGRARAIEPTVQFEVPEVDPAWHDRRVVVVGSGPAGLYAAWTLAVNGVGVDLIDRGPALRERGRAVARFTRTRELDPENNLTNLTFYDNDGDGNISSGDHFWIRHVDSGGEAREDYALLLRFVITGDKMNGGGTKLG